MTTTILRGAICALAMLASCGESEPPSNGAMGATVTVAWNLTDPSGRSPCDRAQSMCLMNRGTPEAVLPCGNGSHKIQIPILPSPSVVYDLTMILLDSNGAQLPGTKAECSWRLLPGQEVTARLKYDPRPRLTTQSCD
jgi:hypothetical protein